jgi:hypothetical protein
MGWSNQFQTILNILTAQFDRHLLVMCHVKYCISSIKYFNVKCYTCENENLQLLKETSPQ